MADPKNQTHKFVVEMLVPGVDGPTLRRRLFDELHGWVHGSSSGNKRYRMTPRGIAECGPEFLASEVQVELLPSARLIGTWCPQCGRGVAVDEDGCCTACGADATGPGADQAEAGMNLVLKLYRELLGEEMTGCWEDTVAQARAVLHRAGMLTTDDE